MHKLLINITKYTVSAVLAISILALNLGSLIHCSAQSMEDNCCHITNKIKSCCVKHYKVTSDPRITKHCGCDMSESQQPSDLYSNDIKNSDHRLSGKSVASYSDDQQSFNSSQTGPSLICYSPPDRNRSGTYLELNILRI